MREELPTLEMYLKGVMSGFRTEDSAAPQSVAPSALPQMVFAVLTSREFCYLSKTRVSQYKEGILTFIETAISQRQKIPFYFDIGGGYHASICPGVYDLSFDVGLAELFVLYQISNFARRIQRFYPIGVKFYLVIDNMCALLINDVPLEKTEGYCARLRDLIREIGLRTMVDLIVESEHYSVSDFDQQAVKRSGAPEPVPLPRKQHDNVERFLGRFCDNLEAVERAQKYQEVIEVSEHLLAQLIRGVHMTQRASENTICFRPFPGADSRIQCGEVAMTRNSKNKLIPFLLTTANRREYVCLRYEFPGLLPSVIPGVTYAERAPVCGNCQSAPHGAIRPAQVA